MLGDNLAEQQTNAARKHPQCSSGRQSQHAIPTVRYATSWGHEDGWLRRLKPYKTWSYNVAPIVFLMVVFNRMKVNKRVEKSGNSPPGKS